MAIYWSLILNMNLLKWYTFDYWMFIDQFLPYKLHLFDKLSKLIHMMA